MPCSDGLTGSQRRPLHWREGSDASRGPRAASGVAQTYPVSRVSSASTASQCQPAPASSTRAAVRRNHRRRRERQGGTQAGTQISSMIFYGNDLIIQVDVSCLSMPDHLQTWSIQINSFISLHDPVLVNLQASFQDKLSSLDSRVPHCSRIRIRKTFPYCAALATSPSLLILIPPYETHQPRVIR
jgi:hypothetical protein